MSSKGHCDKSRTTPCVKAMCGALYFVYFFIFRIRMCANFDKYKITLCLKEGNIVPHGLLSLCVFVQF